MKINKFYIYSIFGIISAILFLTNFSVFIFSPILFGIDIAITLIIVCFVFFLIDRYIKYILDISGTIKLFLDNKNLELLESVPMAMAITFAKSNGDIVGYNSKFKDIFLEGENRFYGNIRDFLPFNLNVMLTSGNTAQITCKGRRFEVSSRKINEFIVFYFFDSTEYKNLKKKYLESRICVGLAVFDNKEELYQFVGEDQGLKLLVEFESVLSEWISNSDGIFKKLSDNKYLMIFEEKYLRDFISEKFEIINKIHEIKVDSHKFATISCGISRAKDSLEIAKSEAENALNMALGRGGDQVAIKNSNSYEFFGGNSQGLEKRSKVRTRVVATALMEKIQNSDTVFIMGHKFSDFDSLGASIGLWSVCSKSQKKPTYIVIDSENSMANSLLEVMDRFESLSYVLSPQEAMSKVTSNSFLIIVDTHSEKFLESNKFYEMFSHTAIIDHHRMTLDKIGNVDIFFHEPFASSTCEMVTELIQYMGDRHLKKWEAECMLAGIMLDTKNFSLKCGVRTFEAGAYLKKKGADSAQLKKIFADSIESYKMKCKIIQDSYIINECAIAKYNNEENERCRVACVQAADELLDVKGVKASFVIFNSGKGVDISARSLGEINVQILMESLGGGGHQTMAAVHIPEINLEEAESKLIDLIKNGL